MYNTVFLSGKHQLRFTILCPTMSHEQVVHLIQVKPFVIRGWDAYISKKAALDDPICQPPCCVSQNILEQQEGKDQRKGILIAYQQEYYPRRPF